VIKDSNLKYLASKSNGSARTAIQTLRKAVILAEKNQKGQVDQRHIRLAVTDNENDRKNYFLRKNGHFRLLYEIINNTPGVFSGVLWRTYLSQCSNKKMNPVAHRTFLHYLNKLETMSIIQSERATIRGNVRSFRIVS
jgi:Cdc6-like AAA superfamily ATPase